MRTQDIPGFYFDHDKNRYFPIRGPVPGRTPKRPPPQQGCYPCSTPAKRCKTAELVHIRELFGKVLNFNKQKHSFKQICRNAQASNPMVWKYQSTDGLADSAVCQFDAAIQTPTGQKETSILSLGSMSGGICIREFGEVGQYLDYGFKNVPRPIWPPTYKEPNMFSASFWGTTKASTNFPCSVSSINKIRMASDVSVSDRTYLQNGMVSTLGCGGSGGSLYILNLTEPLDFASNNFTFQRQIRKVASLDCTLWTAICNTDGKQAAVGTSRGAALISLDSGKISWLYHSKSDIFSQQFDNSGNILLCGHRNGSITSVDIRQRHQRHRNFSRQFPRHAMKPTMKHKKGNSNTPSNIRMPSSVCSLVSLVSDDRYFLGSSMDGSIELFDRRLLERGPVQSYDGHVNSHSRLQLGINPSETLFLSGGEDGYVRIWNIKTAKLLFAERISNCAVNSVCWQQNGLDGCYKSRWLDNNLLMREHSWDAWLGSQEGVFSIHGT